MNAEQKKIKDKMIADEKEEAFVSMGTGTGRSCSNCNGSGDNYGIECEICNGVGYFYDS